MGDGLEEAALELVQDAQVLGRGPLAVQGGGQPVGRHPLMVEGGAEPLLDLAALGDVLATTRCPPGWRWRSGRAEIARS